MDDTPPFVNEKSWHIYALGDDAITIEFGDSIGDRYNESVMQLFAALQKAPLPGMLEAVPAYSSLTIYYDIFLLRNAIKSMVTVQQWMIYEIEKVITALPTHEQAIKEDLSAIRIPVCYEPAFAPDMDFICHEKKIAPAEIIRLHTSKRYRVYMTGFLPGFPYMGETVAPLHIARKQKPVRVMKGSIGLAGKQTGIYPTDSPGGWQIIGRTPLVLFDPFQPTPVLLQPGDRIQFYSISSHEFKNY